MLFKIAASLVIVAALALVSGPATSQIRKGGRGCGALVTQVHPDLQGKARDAEIEKCKHDPDAYIKASGL